MNPVPSVPDNTNRYFKGQQKNEIFLSFCRKHWIVLLPYFFGAILVVILIFLFINYGGVSALTSMIGKEGASFVMFSMISVLTYGLHKFFTRVFNYYIQTIIITNFRVIISKQTLFFNNDRDSIDLPEIQDVLFNQNGIVKTLLNYGELIITLSSAHSSKLITHIPNPEYIFRKINKTKREYITNRRVEKGQIAEQSRISEPAHVGLL